MGFNRVKDHSAFLEVGQDQQQGGIDHRARQEGPVPALPLLWELGDRRIDDHAAGHEGKEIKHD